MVYRSEKLQNTERYTIEPKIKEISGQSPTRVASQPERRVSVSSHAFRGHGGFRRSWRGQTVNQRLRDCTNSHKIHARRIDVSDDVTSGKSHLLGGGRRRLTLLARGHLPVGYSHEMAERRRGAKEGEEKEAASGKSEERRWYRRRNTEIGIVKKRDRRGCGDAHAVNQLSLPLYSRYLLLIHLNLSLSSVRRGRGYYDTTYCCQSVHS